MENYYEIISIIMSISSETITNKQHFPYGDMTQKIIIALPTKKWKNYLFRRRIE